MKPAWVFLSALSLAAPVSTVEEPVFEVSVQPVWTYRSAYFLSFAAGEDAVHYICRGNSPSDFLVPECNCMIPKAVKLAEELAVRAYREEVKV